MNVATYNPDRDILPDLAMDERIKVERFSTYFSQLHPVLLPFLVSRLGGSVSDAQDCLQEVALVLWKKHGSDWTEEDFRRFAFRCAGIEAKAFHRKKLKSGSQLVYLATDLIDSIGETIVEQAAADPADPLQRLDALRLCMEDLDEDQRQLIDARYAKGETSKTINDIAEKSGTDVNILYKRLERLRAALHNCVLKRLKQSHE